MTLKLGDMYVKSFNINDCDNEIQITFTNSIDKAIIFDNIDNLDLYKRLIESSLLITLKEERAEEYN